MKYACFHGVVLQPERPEERGRTAFQQLLRAVGNHCMLYALPSRVSVHRLFLWPAFPSPWFGGHIIHDVPGWKQDRMTSHAIPWPFLALLQGSPLSGCTPGISKLPKTTCSTLFNTTLPARNTGKSSDFASVTPCLSKWDPIKITNYTNYTAKNWHAFVILFMEHVGIFSMSNQTFSLPFWPWISSKTVTVKALSKTDTKILWHCSNPAWPKLASEWWYWNGCTAISSSHSPESTTFV